MSLWQKVKAVFTIRKAVMNVAEVKAGWKTSEFWLVIVTNLIAVVGAIQGFIPATTVVIIMAALNAVYQFLRTIAKGGGTTTPPAA